MYGASIVLTYRILWPNSYKKPLPEQQNLVPGVVYAIMSLLQLNGREHEVQLLQRNSTQQAEKMLKRGELLYQISV